jgi:hypothetical protein
MVPVLNFKKNKLSLIQRKPCQQQGFFIIRNRYQRHYYLLSQTTDQMSISTKNVVFVTGAFVTNGCWDEWRTYFEARGYTTIAPAWPFKNGTAEELRNRQPADTDLALLTLTK